jgi:4a-hydroxytetrahydrobiopterin dehydratase
MALVCDLKQKKCVPCEGGGAALSAAAVTDYLKQVSGWRLQDKTLHKQFTFKNFVKLMEFVNHMAALAEAEGHHPDFSVHYNRLDVTLWTHAAGGLTENDFILAAKIAALPQVG